MPQMSPMYWLTLMITFLLMMILINMIMYFNKNYMTEIKKNKVNLKKLNWKW